MVHEHGHDAELVRLEAAPHGIVGRAGPRQRHELPGPRATTRLTRARRSEAPRPCSSAPLVYVTRRVPEQELVDAGRAGGVDLRPHLALPVLDAEREVLEPRHDACAGARGRCAGSRPATGARSRRARSPGSRRRTRSGPSGTGRASARRSPPRGRWRARPARSRRAAWRRCRTRTRRGTCRAERAAARPREEADDRRPRDPRRGPGRPSIRAARPAGERSRRGRRRRRAWPPRPRGRRCTPGRRGGRSS